MSDTPRSTDRSEPLLQEEIRAELEERLLRIRDRSQDDLETALEEESETPAGSSGELSNLPSHPADAASGTAEADRDFRLAERNTQRLNRIDDALYRLREHPEQYGACEVCGEPIALERLQLVPWTRRCAEHVSEAEDREAR
ncbi:MAG: TraR/DksA C4-type zinc finger protein [Gemmatimonadota bacterium]|jgi:RNA polymerase-binding transcription factor DksA